VTSANPIDVIETGYRLDVDHREWLRSIAQAVRPLLDDGFGVIAYAFDVRVPPQRWLDDALSLEAHPEVLDFARKVVGASTEVAVKTQVDPEVLQSSLEGLRRLGIVDTRAIPHWDDYCRRIGIADILALRTIEPGGRGIVIAGCRASPYRTGRRAKRLWARVSAHLAAARRLRAALAASLDDDGEPEAILTPSGKLEHATSETKTPAAREAVRRQEHARGRERKTDPARAAEAWRALVSGRWSLVDRFERDGRRYLVARANGHSLPDPRALSERERAVAHLAALGKPNKLIAYELGLADSTVASHLGRAIRKLGAKSRVDLVDVLWRLAAADAGGRPAE
jgi:DNA-binding CsgD family transcriptional regulator